MNTYTNEKARKFIEEEAGRCLYCGFCEALCPTKPLGLHRGYGPRGRVSIALMLAREETPSTRLVLESLYTCLLCGACELKCPAKIEIAEVIRSARVLYASSTLKEKKDSRRKVQAVVRR